MLRQLLRFVGLDLQQRFGWIWTLLYRMSCFLFLSITTNISDYCEKLKNDEDNQWELVAGIVRVIIGGLFITYHFIGPSPHTQVNLLLGLCLSFPLVAWIAREVLLILIAVIKQAVGYEKKKFDRNWAAAAEPVAREPAKILARGSDAPAKDPNLLLRAQFIRAGIRPPEFEDLDGE